MAIEETAQRLQRGDDLIGDSVTQKQKKKKPGAWRLPRGSACAVAMHVQDPAPSRL